MPTPPTMAALAALVIAAAAPAPAAASVPTLTAATFNTSLAAHEVALVTFTAPWCGHCKKLKPEMEQAAPGLLDEGIGIFDVDATKERGLAKDHGVRGYPDMRIFRRDLGTYAKYNGPRDAAGISAFMRARAGPACGSLPGGEAPEAWLTAGQREDASPRVRLLAAPAASVPGATALPWLTVEHAAEALRDQIPCASAAAPGPEAGPLALRLAQLSGDVLTYDGPGPEPTPLRRWLMLYSRPPVAELAESNARMYVGARDAAVAILVLPPAIAGRDAQQREYYEAELARVFEGAKALDGPVVWLVYCRADSRVGAQIVDDYKLDRTKPTLFIMDFAVRQRIPRGHAMPGGFDVAGAVAHIAAFKAGDLTPPPTWLEGVGEIVSGVAEWAAMHATEVVVMSVAALVAMAVLCFWLEARGKAEAKAAADSATAAAADAAAETKKAK